MIKRISLQITVLSAIQYFSAFLNSLFGIGVFDNLFPFININLHIIIVGDKITDSALQNAFLTLGNFFNDGRNISFTFIFLEINQIAFFRIIRLFIIANESISEFFFMTTSCTDTSFLAVPMNNSFPKRNYFCTAIITVIQ